MADAPSTSAPPDTDPTPPKAKRRGTVWLILGVVAALIGIAGAALGFVSLPKLTDATKTVDLVNLLAKANVAQQALATELNEITMKGVTGRDPDEAKTNQAVGDLEKAGKPLIDQLPLYPDEFGRRAQALLEDAQARIDRARHFSSAGYNAEDRDVVQFSTLMEDVATINEVLVQAIPDGEIKNEVNNYLADIRGLPVPVIAEGIEDARGGVIQGLADQAKDKASSPRTTVFAFFGVGGLFLVLAVAWFVVFFTQRRKAGRGAASAAKASSADGSKADDGAAPAAAPSKPASPIGTASPAKPASPAPSAKPAGPVPSGSPACPAKSASPASPASPAAAGAGSAPGAPARPGAPTVGSPAGAKPQGTGPATRPAGAAPSPAPAAGGPGAPAPSRPAGPGPVTRPGGPAAPLRPGPTTGPTTGPTARPGSPATGAPGAAPGAAGRPPSTTRPGYTVPGARPPLDRLAQRPAAQAPGVPGAPGTPAQPAAPGTPAAPGAPAAPATPAAGSPPAQPAAPGTPGADKPKPGAPKAPGPRIPWRATKPTGGGESK